MRRGGGIAEISGFATRLQKEKIACKVRIYSKKMRLTKSNTSDIPICAGSETGLQTGNRKGQEELFERPCRLETSQGPLCFHRLKMSQDADAALSFRSAEHIRRVLG